jgi:MoxR-like ATPase
VQIIKGTTSTIVATAGAVLKAEEVLRLQDLVRGVPIADSVVRYAARLVAATRPGLAKDASSRPLDAIHKYISYGASPRASQFLVLGSKARAILAGRYHVDFEDIKSVAHNVLRHRLVLNFHARADNVDSDNLISRLLEAVGVETTK